MVGLRRDGVVLADEVGDGLQQLYDVRPLVAVRYRGVVPARRRRVVSRTDGNPLHFSCAEKLFRVSSLLTSARNVG